MEKINVSDLSEEEVQDLLEKISSNELFATCSRKKLEKIVRNSIIITATPYKTIWSDKERELDLCLVIDGCIAIIYDSDVRLATNALLAPNQIYGEFEFFGFRNKCHKLQSLSNTKILLPKIEDLREIAKDEPEIFYAHLAKTLVQKLRIQNNIIILRSRTWVSERIAYLLHCFYEHPEWNPFIKIDPENENAYEIEVFWSTEIFEQILYTDYKSICRAGLRKLVELGVIEVTHYNKDFEFDKLLDKEDIQAVSEKSKQQISNDDYIKIKVLDYRNLTSKNRIKT